MSFCTNHHPLCKETSLRSENLRESMGRRYEFRNTLMLYTLKSSRSFCVCVCVPAFASARVSVYTFVWETEVNFPCHSLFLETETLTH